jgi:hypothetical protein
VRSEVSELARIDLSNWSSGELSTLKASLVSYFGPSINHLQFAEGLECNGSSIIASDLHLDNPSSLSIVYINMKLQAFLAGYIAHKDFG